MDEQLGDGAGDDEDMGKQDKVRGADKLGISCSETERDGEVTTA